MNGAVDARTNPWMPTGQPADLALIGTFLRRSADEGAALVVTGEPGIGKTLFLDAADGMAAASGAAVLRGQGIATEADVEFGVLRQVLLPLKPSALQLEEAHRGALRIALGLAAGPRPDRLLVSTAALQLLRNGRATAPVLVVVDQLRWIDQPSVEVLTFVARRASGNRIGFLAAARCGADSLPSLGLPVHELAPLAEFTADELLRSRFPALPADVRARVRAEARGNPLALLELPLALTDDQRAGMMPLPTVLPLTAPLRAAFGEAITRLPDPVRRLLLLAALEGTGDRRIAADSEGSGSAALHAAKRACLLREDEQGNRLVFCHPVIRSAAIELAREDERRAAHLDLAALLRDQPDRHAWHLAHAAREPDERIASLLEEVAQRSLARGDAVNTVRTLRRAAELSAGAADRRRRLARATLTELTETGRGDNFETRVRVRVQSEAPNGLMEAAAAASGLLMSGTSDVGTPHRLLVSAIEDITEPHNSAELDEALHVLMVLSFIGGRAELWEPFHRAVSRLVPDVSGTLPLMSATLADPVSLTGPLLDRLSDAVDGLTHELDLLRIVRVSTAATPVDLLAGCRAALTRVLDMGGATGLAIRATGLLAVDDLRAGEWHSARKRAEETINWCEQHGYMMHGWLAWHVLAEVAAVVGDVKQARAHTDEMLRRAPQGARGIQRYAWQARALSAIGHRDFEGAYQYATLIAPASKFPSYVPHVLRVALDLVESCVKTNRQAEASAHVAAMEAAGLGAISPRLHLVVSGCAAITRADVDEAANRFSEALAIPEAERWPFELARIQLLYGERMRRDGATHDARTQLIAALERFQWLGATPWVVRTEQVLRAMGQAGGRRAPGAADRLTPREHQIVKLAASGLRNKEIAEKLALSHRTVAAHLHRAFPKLGVTSRAGLRDVLESSLPRPRNRRVARGRAEPPVRNAAAQNEVISWRLSGPVSCHAGAMPLQFRSRPSVVLVHGAFATASSWSRLTPLLTARQLTVIPVHCPQDSASGDVAAVWEAIDQQADDVLLVGHFWDGGVITDACSHPRVRGAVYVASGPGSQQSLSNWLKEFPVLQGSATADGDEQATRDPSTWKGRPAWFIYGEQAGPASPGQAPMPAQIAQVADVVAQAAAELAGAPLLQAISHEAGPSPSAPIGP